jgi:hypothetical protein
MHRGTSRTRDAVRLLSTSGMIRAERVRRTRTRECIPRDDKAASRLVPKGDRDEFALVCTQLYRTLYRMLYRMQSAGTQPID